MDNVYGINLIPDNDAERVAALDRYQIFNSHREKAFDSICELACELFSCPISHISFLNSDTEFIKAEVGLNGIQYVSRNEGFCAVAILQPDLLLVEDTHQHELFVNHPYVTDKLRIRFYAGAPIITPDGYIIGTLCLIDTEPRSISEKEKKLLKKLAVVAMEQTQLRAENLALLQQRDEFIAVASHEMRTPVTALKAAVQILHTHQDDGTVALQKAMIEQANRSVNKLAFLVNDLFDASRLAARKYSLNKTYFDLGKLINHCCDLLKVSGKHELDIEGDLSVRVVADEERVEQVLVNLIENAMKYAPDSRIILIRISRWSDHVRVEVSDNGPGIDSDQLPHIFKRYFRSENGAPQAGLGLGLYISSEIVKQHGGEIGVESEQGRGSNFWFTLPV
ncbi:GAF domain-containing sensor histidine kinase [Mucilaginibacter endophyticus]|uniref:GAF domain-containing sensor histidine kinase n=1 Tax=Mucilaginibacter endophyticus TaxID=2675003 RepID=UPI000E0D063D|nr:GAF domain-containing sensor histidine kinase [Mucilaginibacter endophyticus]